MNELYGFKADPMTVRKMFDSTNYYHVPDYQRPYSWGDEEIEKLWDDIYSAYQGKDKTYFLGPVILAQAEDAFEVVDGQQRLTSLTILFCVLRDLYAKEDSGRLGATKDVIQNAIKSMVDKKYRLRLVTQAHYQNQFEQEVLEKVQFPTIELSKKHKKKIQYKFMNAARIFREKLEKLGSPDEAREFAKYLFEKVLMITISCSDRASAIKLFRIINTRGMELSTADLVKSSLYSRLDPCKTEQFNSTWRDIETIAERNDETASDLLTYYTYYLAASKPDRAIDEELENQFKSRDPNEVAHEFSKFSRQYESTVNTDSKVIYSLWYLPDRVYWKSVLAAAGMASYDSIDGLATQLRRLYYCFWIAGYTTAKTRDLSFNLIKAINNGEPLSMIIKRIDKKIKEDDALQEARQNLQNDAYEHSWLKPLLISIEYQQTDESKLAFIEYSRNLQIDHILPEAWEKDTYWKSKWTKTKANQWLNRIGNLALLSGKKNSKASNDGFPNKRRIYKGKGIDGTTAFIISQLIAEKADWTEKETKERQERLLSEADKILCGSS